MTRPATPRASADRLAAAWQAARWPLLVGLAVGAFALGFVGFRTYHDDVGVSRSTSDLVYLTLQLYTLESGSVPEGSAPWTLEVARLAAPVATGTALLAALAAAFREQLQEWRLRRRRDHVVICGLGSAGARLASELLTAGYQVVGIELDGQRPAVATLRRRGAVVIVGDARDEATLRRAHVDRAGHLVALTGADDANAELALVAASLTARRTGPALTCLAHIRDPDLCVLMRSEELGSARQGHFRLDFFNVDEHGARLLIRDHPPFPPDDDPVPDPPHVLVVGLNRLGQSLVAEVGRRWRAHPGAGGRPITITVVDPAADVVLARLGQRYPQLAHAARLVPVVANVDPLAPGTVSGSEATIAYVCVDGDSGALHAALEVRRALADPAAPVVVELLRSDGMARLIDSPGRPGRVRVMDVLERTMGPDLLRGGTYELLAQAIHEEYVAEQLRQGVTATDNPAVVPWDQLPDALRESNRDQAAHIGTKLAAVGRGIAPLTDWDTDDAPFTVDEVEALAEVEHQRWVEQRRLDGWTTGPKDVAAKRTPYLVPWDELTDEVKELDRRAVRGIPAFLARAGYQVVSPPA